MAVTLSASTDQGLAAMRGLCFLATLRGGRVVGKLGMPKGRAPSMVE